MGAFRELLKQMVPKAVRKAVWKYLEYPELFRFAVMQRWLDFQIDDMPWLDEDSRASFLPLLENSRYYMEYGSGGSTVLAAKLNKSFISVDTDKYFLKAVRSKIGMLGPHQRLLHGNIGWTTLYGYPVFKIPSARRQKRWKAYIESPWRSIESGLLPDLVMVDGRFRVAVALTSGVHLMNAPESRIVVDDYTDRPFYHEIEAYARLVEIAGRKAIFQPQSTCSPAILAAIDQYSRDWR